MFCYISAVRLFQSVTTTWNLKLCLTCGYLLMGDIKCKFSSFQHWIYCWGCLSEDHSGRRADSIYLGDVRLFKHYATHCFMATTPLWHQAQQRQDIVANTRLYLAHVSAFPITSQSPHLILHFPRLSLLVLAQSEFLFLSNLPEVILWQLCSTSIVGKVTIETGENIRYR